MPHWACRRGSRVAPAPLDSGQKVQAALQARQQREAQLALQRRTLTGANASTSGPPTLLHLSWGSAALAFLHVIRARATLPSL